MTCYSRIREKYVMILFLHFQAHPVLVSHFYRVGVIKIKQQIKAA